MREFRFGRGIDKSKLNGGRQFFTEANTTLLFSGISQENLLNERFKILNPEIFIPDHLDYINRTCEYICDSILHNSEAVVHNQHGINSILEMSFDTNGNDKGFYYVRARHWPIHWVNKWFNLDVKVTNEDDGTFTFEIIGYNIERETLPF